MATEQSPLPFCPVPLEQQPIYEYEQLKDACFFRWVALEPGVFLKRLLLFWLSSWVITGPIAAGSFAPGKLPFAFGLTGALGGSFLLSLLVLRLYLGWLYVHRRLAQTQIVYEESGWYDGQVWTKPADMIARDQLIVTYQVTPLLKRLRRTLFGLGLFMAVNLTGLLWFRL